MSNNSPYFHEILTLGGHVALNFLNTHARDNGQDIEVFHTDKDVMEWLIQQEIYPAPPPVTFSEHALKETATTLRDAIKQLLLAKKNDVLEDIHTAIHALQPFLQESRSWLSIESQTDAHGTHWHLQKHYEIQRATQLLAPIAEAAAQLFTETPNENIKQCEHNDCILWFLDKTKSRKRRWCSMKLCGNRHKIAKFREREKLNNALQP